MQKNKIKTLFSIAIVIFSLFIFVNPTINTNASDTSSEKILDFDEEIETEGDDKEKSLFLYSQNLSFYNLCTYDLGLLYNPHLHNYHNNSSLFKPPIHFS